MYLGIRQASRPRSSWSGHGRPDQGAVGAPSRLPDASNRDTIAGIPGAGLSRDEAVARRFPRRIARRAGVRQRGCAIIIQRGSRRSHGKAGRRCDTQNREPRPGLQGALPDPGQVWRFIRRPVWLGLRRRRVIRLAAAGLRSEPRADHRPLWLARSRRDALPAEIEANARRSPVHRCAAASRR